MPILPILLTRLRTKPSCYSHPPWHLKFCLSEFFLENPSGFGEEEYPPHASDNVFPMLPPTKPKTSLKASKFFPVFAEQTSPRIADYNKEGDEDDVSEPGMYSKLDEGVGDGTHYITASFVKTNEKIKDQLLMQVKYFLDLICANIDREIPSIKH
jgi:hypothetical protein